MAIVTLTEGVNIPSNVLISVWKLLYAISPVACGGCRPLRLSGLVREAGFVIQSGEVVAQLGVPSEIIVAN